MLNRVCRMNENVFIEGEDWKAMTYFDATKLVFKALY